MKLWRSKVNKILKYGFMGALTAALEYVTFLIISEGMNLYVASVISFLVGLISSFLLNKYVVFQSKQRNAREIVQFMVLGLVNSQLSSVLTVFLATYMEDAYAKVVSILFIAVWNFIIMNYVIFKIRTHK